PWQMLVASALLVPLAAVLDPAGRIEPNLPALGGLFYVGVLAGPLATWAAVSVARDLPSVVSSLGFLGIPALGLILSTPLLGEHLTWSLAAGSVLIGLRVVLAGAGNSRALLSVRTARRSTRPRISSSWRSAWLKSRPARTTTASETTSSAP